MAFFLRALRLLNVHIIPVVQTNDLQNYSEKKEVNSLIASKKKQKNSLQKMGLFME